MSLRENERKWIAEKRTEEERENDWKNEINWVRMGGNRKKFDKMRKIEKHGRKKVRMGENRRAWEKRDENGRECERIGETWWKG